MVGVDMVRMGLDMDEFFSFSSLFQFGEAAVTQTDGNLL